MLVVLNREKINYTSTSSPTIEVDSLKILKLPLHHNINGT